MSYDVAIIGAGPCGLAVTARLCEPTPSALFSDAEHNRYWRRFSHRKNTLESELKSKKGGRSRTLSGDDSAVVDMAPPSVVVLDNSSTEWMAAWKSRFQNLQISHLRSPLFFHPDPRDRDALLGFAHHKERTAELNEIRNVVGKEVSKHSMKKKGGDESSKSNSSKKKGVPLHLRIDGRDKIDYFRPSARLFEDFCHDIVDKYSLQNMVKQAEVRAVHYEQGDGFVLDTTDGSYLAKIVVVAVGARPRAAQPPISSQMRVVQQKLGGIAPRHVVVVGGGLTSAQIVDMLIRRHNVGRVWFLLRGTYKIKHFDVDLEWVSKTRNQRMAMFWTADTDDERLQMLKDARGGGSITPEFDKILKTHVKNGRLSIHPNTVWMAAEARAEPAVEAMPETVDHVVWATGGTADLNDLAFLEPLRSQHKIETLGGLPCLSDDMMWNDEVPCFFTGALAGLRLGPGAANLAGARMGAERIAWKVDELLGRTSANHEEVQRDIIGNRFQILQGGVY
ncbi:hypothetical protein DV735_g2954, partial [Chaetothyriales sp. CBS 134920]